MGSYDGRNHHYTACAWVILRADWVYRNTIIS